VLGPVRVWAGGRELGLGRPQQHIVLAVLATNARRLVPAETVIGQVWGPDPPPRARRTLQTYVAAIRRVLEQAAGEGAGGRSRLVHRSGGYLLEVAADGVDLHRFRRLVAQARDPTCDNAQRVAWLREAVGLWRGEPLAGLPGQWAAGMRVVWRQEQVEAVVAWAQAETRGGNPGAVVGPVGELLEEHPLSEPLVLALMTALYAAGSTADALTCFTAARERLVDQLGAEPGAQLQRLQQAILRREPLPGPTDPPQVILAQLPADVTGFAGRGEHLARLDALLAGTAAERPSGVVITAVSGTAGVGKTALAVHWAHQVRDRFPDGQLYVNLRGFDPGGRILEPAAAVRGFLDALGVHPDRVPSDPDAQASLYRSLLDRRRVLVVIDNARDAEQVRPLLPGTPSALVVVTSRNQLTPLIATDGAYPLTLDLLSAAEARQLLSCRLGPDRVAAEPDAVDAIVTACARLPLALSIAAARAAQTGFPLSVLAGELTDARRRLGALDAGDPATQVQAVFSWSYHALTPPAARLFRLLGLHPGPDTAAPAAASLIGQPLARTRPLLTELTRASLLAEQVPGRYRCHDLLAAYATHLTHTEDTDRQRQAGTTRLLDHYVHTAHAADRHLHPHRDPSPVPFTLAASGAGAEQPADLQAAVGWMDVERPVLLAAQQLAAREGRYAHAWQLAWTLTTALFRQGRWHELAAAWQTALAASGPLPAAAAAAHRLLGGALSMLGDHEQAHTHLQHAMHLYTEAADPVGQAHTHITSSGLWAQGDRPDLALDHGRQALTLFQTAAHRWGQAEALNAVGWCHALLGDPARALDYCRQALPLYQELGNRWGEAAAWDSLGYAHHHLSQHTQAATCYTQAITLYRDLDDHYNEADTLTHLGDTHHAAGRPGDARTAWALALTVLTGLGHPDVEAVRARLNALDET